MIDVVEDRLLTAGFSGQFGETGVKVGFSLAGIDVASVDDDGIHPSDLISKLDDL